MSHLIEGRLRNVMAQLKRELVANKTQVDDCAYVVRWADGSFEIEAVKVTPPAEAAPPPRKRKADGDESA